MRNRATGIAIFVLAARCALAQDLVYHFTNSQSPQAMQEVVNITRTLGDIREVSADAAKGNLLVSGTPAQMALTDWLCRQLDQPADAPAARESVYAIAGDAVPAVRLFRLAHADTPVILQELVNVIRTLVDLPRVFPYQTGKVVIVRGTADQIAAVEWLVQALDLPAGPQPAGLSAAPAVYRMNVPDTNVVQVFYLQHAFAPGNMQELVNSLRAVAQLNRVFPANGPLAITARGTADQIDLAAWLVHELDQDAPAKPTVASHAASGAENQARVFHLTGIENPAYLQEAVNTVRAQTGITRAMPCFIPRAVAVRGTSGQVAQAETVIAGLEKQ